MKIPTTRSDITTATAASCSPTPTRRFRAIATSPLISTDNLLGGPCDGEDGDIDPAQLCQGLAFHARNAGAEVYRGTAVTGLTQKKDDTWTVHTDKGDIDADIVVNAGGYRVNEVGAMMGVQHPVASMERQYLVTDDIPAIVEAGHRMPLLRCPI